MGASPYDLLGVPRDADAEALKRAYREAAKRLHPDAGARDATAMVRLNAAYDLLRDPAKRRRYDAANPSGRKPPAADPFGARVLRPIAAALRAVLGALDAAAEALAMDVDDADLLERLDDALDAADVALRGVRWDLAAAPCPKAMATRVASYLRALSDVEAAVEGLRGAAADEDRFGRARGHLDQAVRALSDAGPGA